MVLIMSHPIQRFVRSIDHRIDHFKRQPTDDYIQLRAFRKISAKQGCAVSAPRPTQGGCEAIDLTYSNTRSYTIPVAGVGL